MYSLMLKVKKFTKLLLAMLHRFIFLREHFMNLCKVVLCLKSKRFSSVLKFNVCAKYIPKSRKYM